MIVTKKAIHLPTKWSEWATCYDLRCSEETIILPWEVKLIPTGVKTNFASKIYARSSLAFKRKLMLANSVWIIDADYRNEIKVMVYNFWTMEQIIEENERIAQIEFDWTEDMITDEQIYETWEDFVPTKRWLGWFGSSGTI